MNGMSGWLVAVLGIGAAQEAVEDLSPAGFHAARLEAERKAARREYQAAAAAFLDLWRQNPQDPALALGAAESLLALSRHEEAIPLLEAAYEGGASETYDLSYRLARSNALCHRPEEALTWLERALAHRHVDRPGMAADPAFAELAAEPRFRTLVGLLPEGTWDRTNGWQYDLDFYRSEVARMHVGPGRPGESPPFLEQLAALRARVAELSDEQIFCELQRLTVALGDGHSVVYPIPCRAMTFQSIPLALYWFSDGLTVVGGDVEAALVGSRVEALGGRPVEAVLALLEPYVSRDNAMGLRQMTPFMLGVSVTWRALGLAGPGEAARFDLRTPAGAPATLRVPFASGHGVHTSRLHAPPEAAEQETALWLRDPQAPFWHQELADEDALYVQVNQIQNGSRQTLGEFAAEVRETLRETGTGNVILDLRHNSGGNNFLHWPLVRMLAWFEEESEEHRIFVLTGRRTFSAAQNFLNQVARATHAIVAGEPSGSKPNFTGESTDVELPWSGLKLSISSRWWQDSFPEDERQWIAPRIPATLSSTDWLENRDPVLEAVLEVIRRGL